MTTDPTTILREAIAAAILEALNGRPTELNLYLREANYVLAARIPQACQAAHKGHPHDGCNYNAAHLPIGAWFCNKCGHASECPDCPTLGTLLLYGWNVSQASQRPSATDMHKTITLNGKGYTQARSLLAALREVTP